MPLYLYLISDLLLQTISIINKLNITNATTILIANINIYTYLIKRLTILIIVLIKYNF